MTQSSSQSAPQESAPHTSQNGNHEHIATDNDVWGTGPIPSLLTVITVVGGAVAGLLVGRYAFPKQQVEMVIETGEMHALPVVEPVTPLKVVSGGKK